MTKIASGKDWHPIDMTGLARPWKSAGVRQPTNGQALRLLGYGVRHLLGSTPRLLFAQAWTPDDAPTCPSSLGNVVHPRWFDSIPTSDRRIYGALHASPGTVGAVISASGASMPTPAAASSSWPSGVRYASMAIERSGAPTDAMVDDTVQANGSTVLYEIACQEDYVSTLDSSRGHRTPTAGFFDPSGEPVEAWPVDELSGELVTLREDHVRVLACYMRPSGSPLTYTSTTLANIIDGSVARAAGTPGVSVPGYMCANGSQTTRAARVYVRGYSWPSGGLIRVVGPLDYADVTLPGSMAWTQSGGTVSIDATVADDDATASANKMDIWARAPLLGTVYISSIVIMDDPGGNTPVPPPGGSTRLYFSIDNPGVTPIANASWGSSTWSVVSLVGVHSGSSLYALDTDEYATESGTETAWAGAVCAVSAPLAEDVTISCDVRMQTGAVASGSALVDARDAIEIYVINGSNTAVRGTLLSQRKAVDTSIYSSGEYRNKAYADGDSTGSVNALEGDRIVVRYGSRLTYTVPGVYGTSAKVAMKIGAPTGTSDLPEDETTMADGVAWIEFSQPLTFSSGGRT